MNFAQPGFSFEQKLAVARQEVARYKPTLIMWEDWVEWHDYALLGKTAYGIHGMVRRPDGFIGVAGVPDFLNRILFEHSRAYEYLVIAAGERIPVDQDLEAKQFVDERLVKVPELAKSAGSRLALYLAPPLDKPFAQYVAEPPLWHREILRMAKARGLHVYQLQRELEKEDFLQIRQDPCCHYNAEGHKALVPIMKRLVLQELDGPRSP
jgi:hypothetical protein